MNQWTFRESLGHDWCAWRWSCSQVLGCTSVECQCYNTNTNRVNVSIRIGGMVVQHQDMLPNMSRVSGLTQSWSLNAFDVELPMFFVPVNLVHCSSTVPKCEFVCILQGIPYHPRHIPASCKNSWDRLWIRYISDQDIVFTTDNWT